MLCELQIENIAIIKKAVLTFSQGFTVMTGETGAGKSIVIDSINAVLGERTSRELIRTGADSAYVSALFYETDPKITALLREMDLPNEEDGSVLIQRRLFADGRNNCKINGVTVTVSAVKRVAKQMVNIHGQLDNQSLLSPDSHCAYIDSLAEDADLLEAYASAYRAYLAAQRELRSMHIDENEKLRRLDILNYQIAELESAELRVGECAELEARLEVLRNAAHITELLQRAHACLCGGEDFGGAATLAFDAAKSLEQAGRYSEEFASLLSDVREAAYTLSACGDELRDKLYSDDFDPAQIDRIEERLDLLYGLQRKYGGSETEMLEFLQNAVDEREKIEMSDEILERLQKEADEAYAAAYAVAERLSAARKTAGEQFCRRVCEKLSFLDMPSVRFFVQNTRGELTENGLDAPEFLLSANVGEAPKPLAKIASGGELSRIMLAIKSVLAQKDDVGTLIFDEIDSGVSGRAAQKIAILLSEVSRSHQVICVTHLAQIAAFADAHMRIEKSEREGQTYTEVVPLDFIGRKHELARILGGLTVTALQLQNAEELLKTAEQQKMLDKA